LEADVELHVMQPITWLTLDPISPNGIRFEKDIRIGCDLAAAKELAEKFLNDAGRIDTFQLANNPAYTFVANQYGQGTMDEPNCDAYLRIFVVRVQVFLLALWFVKDNSANALKAYLRVDDSQGPHCLAQTYTTWFSSSDCQYRSEHFSQAQLAEALKFYGELTAAIPHAPENEPQLSGLVHGSRLARAIYMLEAARNSSDLLVKIAFYCMCLESLFSTDKEGITYRIAERTALFAGTTGQERRLILTDVSKLYGTRSSVVHGDAVRSTQLPSLIERVKRTDGYLRVCLTKVLRDPPMRTLFSTQPKEAIVEHFKAQVFGT
jgi:hypothetical protein